MKRIAALEEQVRELREALDNAPHSPDCDMSQVFAESVGNLPCSCWKFALAQATEPKTMCSACETLRAALERIFLMDKCPSPGDGCAQCIAREALKPKERE